MITAAEAKEKLLEKEIEEFTVPGDVEQRLDEYINNALDQGYSYTVLFVSKFATNKSDEVDKYVIDNFHHVIEYLRSNGYNTSVATDADGRCVYISW